MTDRPSEDPDRSEEDDVGRGGGPRRPFNWDAVTAVAALIVGVIAILISAYTAWSTRQQTYAQVWPHVMVGAYGAVGPALSKTYGVAPDDGGQLAAVNSGVGPAIVRRVEVLVNGKPEPDWSHVFRALGYSGRPPRTATSVLNGQVFAPRQKISLLAMVGNKAWVRFRNRLYQEVVIRTCYCSTLGDCWMDTWNHSVPFNKQTQSVGSCAKIPEKDEFNG